MDSKEFKKNANKESSPDWKSGELCLTPSILSVRCMLWVNHFVFLIFPSWCPNPFFKKCCFGCPCFSCLYSLFLGWPLSERLRKFYSLGTWFVSHQSRPCSLQKPRNQQSLIDHDQHPRNSCAHFKPHLRNSNYYPGFSPWISISCFQR